MQKVKVIGEFRDREADLLLREKDDILEVSEERAKKLKGLGLVEDVTEEPVEPEEPKPQKRTRKK